MSKAQIERRLRDLSERLRIQRDDLRVTEEQLVQFNDEAEDARLRAVVSETPLAERDHREAARHRDKMLRHRDDLREAISELEVEQDRLLDQLTST